MPKNKNIMIKYTSRDFESIKSDLIEYTKRYYPDGYRDFSEASFGSLMLDLVSYTGDILSYYLDYHVNESFLDTSLEFENIRKHARSLGYKFAGSPASFGVVSLFILCPANTDGIEPDRNYLPKLKRGSVFSNSGGVRFLLVDDVDFANPDNEVVVGTEIPEEGTVTSYVVKAYGKVMSGEVFEESIEVGDFSRFLTIPLSNENITEIELQNISDNPDAKKILWKASSLLNKITNDRWMISLSTKKGLKTLVEFESEIEKEKIEKIKKNTFVKKILEIIPLSEVVSVKEIDKS